MPVLSRIVVDEVHSAITMSDWRTSMLDAHRLRRQQVPPCCCLLLCLLLSKTTCATVSLMILPQFTARAALAYCSVECTNVGGMYGSL